MKSKPTFKQRAKQLKTDIPAVFLALRHKKTPLLAKIIAGVAVAYTLSPIDLIPDFIPLLGLLDDIIIVPALIVFVVKLTPPDVFAECRKEAEGLWAEGKPKKWYYAIPIMAVWGLLIFLIMKLIF
ncbi:MAG: YkvA family protein [Oscillospiraceae bacterium]|nr:YkvA family protein [Oscillospiraceae bacterium]